MKLSNLRDILAVAECGSLRAASRHLKITQPAITRSIREIEKELGVSLFERHAKGVRLTSMGKAFVRRASTIQSELRRAREEIEQLKSRGTGQVSIALSIGMTIALLPTALEPFRKRFPAAVLMATESIFQPVESALLEGSIDLYVGPLEADVSHNEFAVEKLFDNRRVVIARKKHPLATRTTLAGLKDAQWIRPTVSGRSGAADVDTILAKAGLASPSIVMHSSSALVTLQAVAASDMVTIMPRQWLEFPATANQLTEIKLVEPLPTVPICIVTRRDLPLTPMAEYLADMVRRAASQYVKREYQAA